jgi:hypothetical protein
MTLWSHGQEFTESMIRTVSQRAIDAHTAEEAAGCHSQLIDLLAVQAMAVRRSLRSAAAKEAAIDEINRLAATHRDALDRLTDIIEAKQGLVWRS